MKGFSGKFYKVKAGDKIVHPCFYGHKNFEFTVTDYDLQCGEMIRNNGDGGKKINLDVCTIISA